MVSALFYNFSGDFEPEEFVDEYQEQLRTLVEAKLEQGETVDTEETFGEREEGEEAEVLDLMEALRRSVSAAKEKKSGGGSSSSSSSSSSSGSRKKSTSKIGRASW